MNTEQLKQQKSIKELLEFGIINIDKPSGPTSFNISDFVRKTLKPTGIRKTSHFGTLDPKVTGILPVALNRACKLTGYFLGEDKEYVGIMRIHEDIELEKIKKAISEKFTGKIRQTPPVKSRVKREERTREVKSFNLLEKDDKDILFSAEVEGGTYIRKLIDDLGRELGIGAHMLELRRVRAGIFKENDKTYPSVNLYDFEKAVKEYESGNEEFLRKIIIPGEVISELHPVIEIKKDNLKQIFTGKPVHKNDLKKQEKVETGKIICIFSDNKFIGMYKVVNSGDITKKSEIFGDTKSQTVPSHRHGGNDFDVFAKAEFVMQPIK